jgi:ribosomal protein S18 acetylase RimI-like enzyme
VITIRHARPEDLAAVRDLLAASWQDTYEPIYGRTKVDALTARWHSLEALAAQHRRGVLRLVADADGRLLGTASATVGEDGTIHLRQLYVHPDHKRRGIGAALLDAMVTACPSARRVTLEVEPENISAVAFYARQGFTLSGEIVERDDDGAETRHSELSRALI